MKKSSDHQLNSSNKVRKSKSNHCLLNLFSSNQVQSIMDQHTDETKPIQKLKSMVKTPNANVKIGENHGTTSNEMSLEQLDDLLSKVFNERALKNNEEIEQFQKEFQSLSEMLSQRSNEKQ
jgi:hypothetical protein